MSIDAVTDRDLIDGWLRGDETAASELIRRHAGAVARFLGAAGADREDLEDLVQETFFRAFRRVESYRGGATFRTWVIAIGSNVLKDMWRKKKHRTTISLDDRDFVDESSNPAAESQTRDILARMTECLRGLPRLQRDVFILRAQQGASYDEIANALGTSAGAARVHYHHAVKRLKGLLRAEEGET